MKTGIIILAAGPSGRLGKPKQLLEINGKTLVRRVSEIALSVNPNDVMVITGAQAEKVSASVSDLNLSIVHNEEWEEGMASSIRIGVLELQRRKADAALILLCDQIKVDQVLIQNILEEIQKAEHSIVCCRYGGRLGTPAAFKHAFFDRLLELKGNRGAKQIIESSADKKIIEFPGGELDIDQPADLNLLSGNGLREGN
jgi:molybdenum cofactor cytidylyltransferase